MARTTKIITRPGRTAKAALPAQGKTAAPGRGAAKAAKPAGRAPVAKAVAKSAGRAAPLRAPIQNKQELRDRIDKLERANVNLRIKNREATEALRAGADRIDALEEELAGLRSAEMSAGTVTATEPARKPRGKRRAAADRDPGDAVPPGVAPLDAEPMDAEARDAKRSLERQLSSD